MWTGPENVFKKKAAKVLSSLWIYDELQRIWKWNGAVTYLPTVPLDGFRSAVVLRCDSIVASAVPVRVNVPYIQSDGLHGLLSLYRSHSALPVELPTFDLLHAGLDGT